MDQFNPPLSRDNIYNLLQGCVKRKDLATARRVYSLMVSSGLDSISVLGDHLIRLFAYRNNLAEANQVFKNVGRPSVYTWNAIISAHAKLGEGDQALRYYQKMQDEGIKADNVTWLSVLEACGNVGAEEKGRFIHERIIASGLESDLVVGSALVTMYVKCESAEEARKVFDKLRNRDTVSWGAMISGYAQQGCGLLALELFEKMQADGIEPDEGMLVWLLKVCGTVGDIVRGKSVHKQICSVHLQSDMVIGSSLINMYAKCGHLKEAHAVFDKLPNRDVVVWDAIISGYAEQGLGFSAIELFHKMQQQAIKPDKVTFLSILKACSSLSALDHGRAIHAQIMCEGIETDMMLSNTLIDMYGKSGTLLEARCVFDKLSSRGVVSWDAMIAGYAHNGHEIVAIKSFLRMKSEGLKPNKVTFLCVLKACGSMRQVECCRWIHDEIMKSSLEWDAVVENSLIDVYAKCRSVEDAIMTFDGFPDRDVFTWGTMIGGYTTNGDGLSALDLLCKMQQEGLTPDKVIFLNSLKACGIAAAVVEGMLIHEQIIMFGLESELPLGNSLIDMYAKCSCLREAQKVFQKLVGRNVVSWGALISGCAQLGQGFYAIKLFERMQQEGIQPDQATFSCTLKACGSISARQEGRSLHDHIIQNGFTSDVLIGNALVSMHIKLGSLEQAHEVFDELVDRDVVSWGAMIAGYTQQGKGYSALVLYQKMRQEGMLPNGIIALCTLKACGSIGAMRQGRVVHDEVIKTGLLLNAALGNALVDMYAKCGSLEEAHHVFHIIQDATVVSWGTIITGYARDGKYKLVMQGLQMMQQKGFKPDDLVFTSVLGACSYAGLLKEAFSYFKNMTEEHGISPSMEHYSCIIDVLGRAGCLIEARDLVQTLPILPDVIAWMSLLTSCRTYSNIELGTICFNQVLELTPTSACGYELLSNIYTNTFLWENVEKLKELKHFEGVQKQPGKAWIELGNKMHEYIVGDKSPSDSTCKVLQRLGKLGKKEGYVPKLDLALQSELDPCKNNFLWGDFKRVAIALGLVSTALGGTTFQTTSVIEMSFVLQRCVKILFGMRIGYLIFQNIYHDSLAKSHHIMNIYIINI